MEVKLHTFITFAVDRCEYPASSLRPLYPVYVLNRRLGGAQTRSGHGRKEIIPAPSEIERQLMQIVFCFGTAELLGVAVEVSPLVLHIREARVQKSWPGDRLF